VTDIRSTALADQAAAADADAAMLVGQLAGAAAATGAPVLALGRLPFHDRLNDRLRAALVGAVRAGQPPTCAHLDFTTPAVAHWIVSAAGRLRCAPCANHKLKREQGRESCNLCGRRRELHAGAYRIPPSAVFERGERPPTVLAGVVVHWTACAECLAAT
jgi:hypothetical protein